MSPHFYNGTKTGRGSKRKRSAANTLKRPKTVEFYRILQKSKTQLPLPWSWEPGLSSLTSLSSHISTGKRRPRRLLALIALLAHFSQKIRQAEDDTTIAQVGRSLGRLKRHNRRTAAQRSLSLRSCRGRSRNEQEQAGSGNDRE